MALNKCAVYRILLIAILTITFVGTVQADLSLRVTVSGNRHSPNSFTIQEATPYPALACIGCSGNDNGSI